MTLVPIQNRWLVAVMGTILMIVLGKLFSSDSGESGIGGVECLLISSIALFPAFSAMLTASLIWRTGILSMPQIIVLLSGLGIYAVSYSVLLLFNTCTRLLGIRGGGTVFVVSSLLLVSCGITGFLVKLLLI